MMFKDEQKSELERLSRRRHGWRNPAGKELEKLSNSRKSRQVIW